ncbi:MAG: hypothetical protein ACI4JB_03310 [Porcipelethomonas sp.]
MNFEETYKKYKNGEATEEEKAFIEGEIVKARKISAILDRDIDEKAVDEVDGEIIKKAKKAFRFKTTIRTVIIVISCVAVLTGITVGGVLGISLYSAGRSIQVTEDEAIDLAKDYVIDNIENIGSEMSVEAVKRELELDIKLTDSVYIYEIKIDNGGNKYKIEVNSVSGYARIVDIYTKDEHKIK